MKALLLFGNMSKKLVSPDFAFHLPLNPGHKVMTGSLCSIAGILVLDMVVRPLRCLTTLSFTWNRNARLKRTLIVTFAVLRYFILSLWRSFSLDWHFKGVVVKV